MTSLFLIRETQYAGIIVERMDYCGLFYNMKDARKALLNQINNLASSDKANEMQPTMNDKDFFHFYVKQPNGFEEKRYIVISKDYKSSRKSILMNIEAINKVKAQ